MESSFLAIQRRKQHIIQWCNRRLQRFDEPPVDSHHDVAADLYRGSPNP